MGYQEEDYLMISGIQHFQFCKRQWALIHIEQQWAENIHTVKGELMHKKAHDPYLTEKRKDVLGLKVFSDFYFSSHPVLIVNGHSGIVLNEPPFRFVTNSFILEFSCCVSKLYLSKS